MKIRLLPPTWSQIKRWRRLRIAKREQENNPLREFLYLDDTGVYSLYASRFGPVPKEYSNSVEKTSNAESGAEFGFDVGPVKAKASPKLSRGSKNTRSVTSNASVQALFKEWLDFERDHFALQPPSTGAIIPSARSVSDLQKIQRSDSSQCWILSADHLVRGAVVDVDVELASADVFRLSTIFSEMLELAKENPEHVGTPMGDVNQVEAITRVVERFLVGLIPLESKVVDYVVVPVDGQEWVVHADLTKSLPSDIQGTIRPLYLVGVTDSESYWKDIRRILFNGSRARVVARLDKSTLSREWNAVKLVDLLRDINPILAESVASGFRSVSEEARKQALVGTSNERAAIIAQRKEALRAYGRELHIAGTASETIALSELMPGDDRLGELAETMEDPEGQRDAYRAIESILHDAGAYFTGDEAAEIREEVTDKIIETSVIMPESEDRKSSSKDPKPRYLESEFVAIYW